VKFSARGEVPEAFVELAHRALEEAVLTRERRGVAAVMIRRPRDINRVVFSSSRIARSYSGRSRPRPSSFAEDDVAAEERVASDHLAHKFADRDNAVATSSSCSA